MRKGKSWSTLDLEGVIATKSHEKSRKDGKKSVVRLPCVAPAKRGRLSSVVWAITIATTIALFAANLFLGELNQDEGWYLYGARQVARGEVPYRDFAFTQGPVMLYVYALAAPLINAFGVAGGRLVTTLFGLAGAVCAALLAARLVASDSRRGLAAFLAFVLVGVNAYQGYFTALVKTYALGGFLLVLGFILLVRALEKSVHSGFRFQPSSLSFLSGVVLTLCAGTRISAGIALPIIFVILLIRSSRSRDPIVPQSHSPIVLPLFFLLGVMLASCAVFLPFLLTAPDSFIFSVVRYHAGRDAGGLMGALLVKGGSVSRLIGAYFVSFSLLAITLFLKFFYKTPKPPSSDISSPTFQHSNTPALQSILLSLIAIALVHFLAPFPYDEYQVMVFPLFAAILAPLVVDQFARIASQSDAREKVCVMFVGCVLFVSLAGVVASTVVQDWVVRDIDRLWLRKRDVPQLIKLRQTADYVKELAGGAGAELLTQDPYLAVEAGMDIPKGLEMGQFSYFPDMSRADAERRNVLNAEMLRELLRTSKAPVAAFSGYGLAVRSPEVAELSIEEQKELNAIVEERYELRKEVEHFGQADTVLRIYELRKTMGQ